MMSASNWIISVCLLTCFLICSVSEEITVKSGDDVPLQCQGPRDADIDTVMVKWIRLDLKESEGFVFSFRDNNTQENLQHEPFHGRVELMDPQMKDGNFSVILKNVTINDTGTYECYVGNNGGKPQRISTTNLTVIDSGDAAGDKDKEEPDGNNSGHVGLTLGLSVGVILVAVVVCFLIYKKRGGLTENNSNPRKRKRKESKAEEETELQQLRNDTLNPDSSVT